MDHSLESNLSLPLDPIEREGHPFHPTGVKRWVASLAAGLSRVDIGDTARRISTALPVDPNEDVFLHTATHVLSTLITIEPDYSRLAARSLRKLLKRELEGQGILRPLDSIRKGIELGLIASGTLESARELRFD